MYLKINIFYKKKNKQLKYFEINVLQGDFPIVFREFFKNSKNIFFKSKTFI